MEKCFMRWHGWWYRRTDHISYGIHKNTTAIRWERYTNFIKEFTEFKYVNKQVTKRNIVGWLIALGKPQNNMVFLGCTVEWVYCFLEVYQKLLYGKQTVGKSHARYVSVYKNNFCLSCSFGSFEFFKSYLVDERKSLSTFNSFFCGLGSGIVESMLVTTPMETLKVKLINDRRSEKPKFRGIFHAAHLIIKTEGMCNYITLYLYCHFMLLCKTRKNVNFGWTEAIISFQYKDLIWSVSLYNSYMLYQSG